MICPRCAPTARKMPASAAPSHDRRCQCVVNQKRANERGDARQRGEIELKRAQHRADLLTALRGPTDRRVGRHQRSKFGFNGVNLVVRNNQIDLPDSAQFAQRFLRSGDVQ